MRRLHPTELQSQIAVMEWAFIAKGRYPSLALLMHIPNGGSRDPIEAARLKAAGVKRGVPDLFLPVPRGPYHGLFVEMKSEQGRMSPEQQAWIAALSECGYRAVICVGAESAIGAIQDYLEIA